MSKTMTKSFAAALFAALFALFMVPSLAFANTLEAGSIDAQADYAADGSFQVNVRYLTSYDDGGNAIYSDAVQLKKYSADEFKDLAGTEKTDALAYLYSGKSGAVVRATKNYVTLVDILKDAGIDALGDGDQVRFVTLNKAGDGIEEYSNSGQKWYGVSGGDLKEEFKFFPNYTKKDNSKNSADAVDAPSVIALSYGQASIADDSTSANAALKTISDYGSVGTTYQHCIGQTIEDFEANGVQGGYKQASSTVGINVYINSLDKATISDIANQTYSGSALTPAVTVKFEGGEALKAGADYDVAYANNIAPGTATVTITGKGDYSGTVTKTFKINDTAAHASNINSASVTAAQIKAASDLGATSITLGANVKKISKNAFKGTKIKTIVVQSKKLKKSGVKKALKGSKVKTVKVNVGSKKQNKKYVKKYKKIFTKANCGKKVKVK